MPLVSADIDERHLDEAPEGLAGLTARRMTTVTDTSVTGGSARRGSLQAAGLIPRSHPPTAVIEHHADQARLTGTITTARLMERLIGEQ